MTQPDQHPINRPGHQPCVTLILASASPRRAELLAQMGVPARLLPVDIDESPLAGELPADYVVRLAREKARQGYREALARAQGRDAPVLVIGSDTTVVLGGVILGKPADQEDARQTLRRLSGQTHEVMTAVALAGADGLRDGISVARVTFRCLSEPEIEAYCKTGEPMDKAGSYGIQGYGGVFVSRLEGSYSAVVGLPLELTAGLLAEAGVPVWHYWPNSE